MNELPQKLLTSVEVAEMVEKQHSELLKDVRRYITQLAEGNIPSGDFFTESTYQDANNQDRPCYLVSKKGCEFIGNKLTGAKGTVFTAKYINKFNSMEQAIQSNQQVPQSLIALQGMINQMIEQEVKINQANQQSQKALETSQAIKDTLIGVYDNWRESIKYKVSAIQKGSNMTFQEVWNMLYDSLEKKAHCDLSTRVSNGRFRLTESGATKGKVDAFGRLDVIEADPKLKEIFTSITKEYVIRYVA